MMDTRRFVSTDIFNRCGWKRLDRLRACCESNGLIFLIDIQEQAIQAFLAEANRW